MTPGAKFRQALKQEKPLQVVGAINAYHAILAKASGFKAIYLSGGGVAAGSLGMPDLGISNLDDVLTDIRRITDICDLPLLVDVDTGFGASAFNVARTVKSLVKFGAGAMHIEDQVGAKRCGHRPGKELVSKEEMVDRIKAAVDAKTDPAFFIIARTTRSLIKFGAGAMHIEDQVGAKRCGHRPGKELVSREEMCDRIKSAVDARTDPDFVIMARTEALASEGLERALERAKAYVEAGADMIFPEAITDLPMYKKFAAAVKVPILANITEFGQTPLFTVDELRSADVAIALYPLTAFRAMNKAALKAYETVRKSGTQKSLLPEMQTREELYDIIGYHDYEKKLDELFARGRS